jgi:hypothetical protein
VKTSIFSTQLNVPKPIKIGPPYLYKYVDPTNNDAMKLYSEDIAMNFSENSQNKSYLKHSTTRGGSRCLDGWPEA